jgi:hypothetical protein
MHDRCKTSSRRSPSSARLPVSRTQKSTRMPTGSSTRCTPSTSNMLISRLRMDSWLLQRSTLIFFPKSILQRMLPRTGFSRQLHRKRLHRKPRNGVLKCRASRRPLSQRPQHGSFPMLTLLRTHWPRHSKQLRLMLLLTLWGHRLRLLANPSTHKDQVATHTRPHSQLTLSQATVATDSLSRTRLHHHLATFQTRLPLVLCQQPTAVTFLLGTILLTLAHQRQPHAVELLSTLPLLRSPASSLARTVVSHHKDRHRDHHRDSRQRDRPHPHQRVLPRVLPGLPRLLRQAHLHRPRARMLLRQTPILPRNLQVLLLRNNHRFHGVHRRTSRLRLRHHLQTDTRLLQELSLLLPPPMEACHHHVTLHRHQASSRLLPRRMLNLPCSKPLRWRQRHLPGVRLRVRLRVRHVLDHPRVGHPRLGLHKADLRADHQGQSPGLASDSHRSLRRLPPSIVSRCVFHETPGLC